MKLSRVYLPALAVVFLAAVAPAFSQTVPSAYQGTLPFTVGAGATNFDVDWGQSRMFGIAAWAQWRPGMLPRVLNGLGLDVEGKDIDYGRPITVPSNYRLDTFGGGPIYTWHHFRNIQPYGKFLIGIGSIDFHSAAPHYNHDTRTVYAEGGGLQYQLIPHLWVRADYEYQMWPGLFGRTLDPQGFTLGASYDFRAIRLFH